MTTENWALIEEIFDQAVNLDVKNQLDFVESKANGNKDVATQVMKMLESKNQDFMGQFPGKISTEHLEISQPKTLGNFKIIKKIATGGMGRVYLAESISADVSIKVALKTIRIELINENLKIKFQNEKSILSKLRHKNIATLIDAGVTDENIPYIATEWVDGENIKKYCLENKLSIKQRLKLFLQICSAVSFAHNKLIVHRDLKPDNILVDSQGQVKLLDFGIAKIIDDNQNKQTQTQIYTPDYAAPEQINGEQCGLTTDVYSLGVVLFEILTNSKRFELTDLSVSDKIKAVNSPTNLNIKTLKIDKLTPYSLARISGVLETIINKAMHIDPNRRYESVYALVSDVENYLDKRPIKAMKDNVFYKAKMLLLRNKLASSILAFTFITISIAIFVLINQIRQKLIEAQKSKQVTEFLIESIQASNPDLTKGKDISVIEFLQNAKIRIQNDSFDDMKLNAILKQTIGIALTKVGEYKDAEKLLLQSIEVHQHNFKTHISLANLYLKQKSYTKAKKQLQFLRKKDSLLTIEEIIQVYQIEAEIYSTDGDFEQANAIINAAIKFQLEESSNTRSLIKSKLILATILELSGKINEPNEILRETLEISKSQYGNDSTITTEIYNQLARTLTSSSPVPWDEVFNLYQLAIKNQIKIYGPYHPIVAKTLLDEGFAMRFVGNLDAANTNATKAMKIALRNFGSQHMLTAHINFLISQIYFSKGDMLGAIDKLQNVLEVYARFYGEDHFETNQIKTTLAIYFIKIKKGQEALDILNLLLISQKEQLGEFNKATFYVMMNILKAHLLLEDYNSNFVIDGEATLKNAQKHLGKENILTIGIQIVLAEIYLQTQNPLKASKLSEELMTFDMVMNNVNIKNRVNEIMSKAKMN